MGRSVSPTLQGLGILVASRLKEWNRDDIEVTQLASLLKIPIETALLPKTEESL